MIKTFFSSLRIIFYLFILVLVYVFYLSRDLPSLERLETFDPAMLSTLYDRNGEVIGEFYIQKRVFVDIEDMPNHLKNAAIASEDKRFYSHWGVDLQSEHERYLVEKEFNCPVILRDYPAKIKAFYMRFNDDEKTVAAMDVLFPGVGEIVGGSQREERHEVLSKKCEEFNEFYNLN